jgi:hypothetical protein
MKITGMVCAFFFVMALAFISRPAVAAQDDSKAGLSAAKATQLQAVPPNDAKPPKDKPKKSKKNDDKDGDPDDGNAGKGNDDKTLPNDGPAAD